MSFIRYCSFAMVFSVVIGVSLASAHAQDDAATIEPAPAHQDGGRFRWGVNAAGGYEFVSSVSGPMVGADARFGYQINNLLGIYVSPHLSFGSLSTDSGGASISGATGTFALTALGEVTLADMFFIGAGAGYGVLNNPSGFTLHARGGLYPLMSYDEDGPGRSGLMIGADIKTVFIDGATGVLVTATLGYESF